MLNCSLSLSFFNWVAIYSFIAAVFFPTVVTYLYGHYRQGEQKAENKRMSFRQPIRFLLFVQFVSQNGSDIDLIDNIYHPLFASMFRMPAYYHTV